jgi:hypothetical protein
MKTSFDTDTYLFELLKNAPELQALNLTGNVYAGNRPLNSTLEDVAINTIALTQEYLPQLGTSNINIHVKDLDVKIGGVSQKMQNRARLKQILDAVLSVVRAGMIQGVGFTIENQTVIAESSINQHYVNIRINWFIH